MSAVQVEPAAGIVVSGRRLAVFIALAAVVLAFQFLLGAYGTERAAYSDEASHLLNGMLLRDFILSGQWGNPIAFAKAYYLSYPKIAPGMWPPLFHTVLGVLLLGGGAPDFIALGLIALTTAWTAWRLWTISVRIWGPIPGAIISAVFLITPAVIDLSTAVMLDVVVAALALEATYWLAEYAVSLERAHAMLFGLFAAFACLTKGNGIAIVLVPPILIALTGRYDLLKRSGVYIAALMVLVLAFPPVWFSYRLDAEIGDFGRVTPAIVAERTIYYALHFLEQYGIVAALMVGIAISKIAARRARATTDHRDVLPAALAALFIAAILFHLFNPHIVIARRYITLAFAPFIGLTAYGARSLSLRVEGRSRPYLVFGLSALAIGHAVFGLPAPISRQALGLRMLTDRLAAQSELAGNRLLIVSDERGEGAFVSEIALKQLSPRPMVVRGSKLLATDDWNGNHFSLTMTSGSDLMGALEDMHIAFVVVDESPVARELGYYPVVTDALAQSPTRISRVASSSGSRAFSLYRVARHRDGPPADVPLRVSKSLAFIGQASGRN